MSEAPGDVGLKAPGLWGSHTTCRVAERNEFPVADYEESFTAVTRKFSPELSGGCAACQPGALETSGTSGIAVSAKMSRGRHPQRPCWLHTGRDMVVELI